MTTASKWTIAILASAAMLPSSIVFAQGPDSAGPPPPGQETRPVTVADTPLNTLTSVLSLTPTQQSQISAIQLATREQIRDLLPGRPDGRGNFGQGGGQNPGGFGQSPDSQGPGGFGGPGGPGGPGQDLGGPGGPGPDQQSGQNGGPGGFDQQRRGRPAPLDAATKAKIDAVESTATTQIDSVLTKSQIDSLNTLIGQLKDLQGAGIAPHLYGKLQLTSDELTQIHAAVAAADGSLKIALEAAISSGDYSGVEPALQESDYKAHSQVIALLTPSQVQIASSDSGNRRGPGGRQFGGRPQGFGFTGPDGQFGGPGGDNAGGPPQGGPGGDLSADQNGPGY